MASTTALSQSNSRSRIGTPIRAITSSLSSRSSPSVPPASHTYEPLLKSVLRHRLLYNIFAFSAVFSWGLTVLWSENNGRSAADSLTALVKPTTFFLALVNWAVGVLAVIVLRKTYLTATPTSASSPAQTVHSAVAKARTARALITYSASALVLAAVYTTMSEPSARLSLFVKSKKHPYYLNGRLLFLFLAQITLAFAFTLRAVLLDRFFFRWSPSPQTSTRFPHPSLLKTVATAVFLPILAAPVSVLLVLSVRAAFLTLPIPFARHFVRGGWWVPIRHIGLIWRAWVLGAGTVGGWEWAEGMFDVVVPLPTKLAQLTASPAVTLVSAVSSPTFPAAPEPMHYYAYDELLALSPAERAVIFTEQKYNPGLWNVLVREALGVLGRDWRLFVAKGKPPAPDAAPASAPSPALKGPQTAAPTPLIEKQIFKPGTGSPLRSVLDSLAADGQVAGAVPELFRSVPVPAEAKKVEEEVKKEVGVVAQEVKRVVDRVKNVGTSFGTSALGEEWNAWWGRERVDRIAEVCLPNRELDILVVRVLAQLTCASLEEDRYGVVQRDIPRILEAFLKFLDALEQYQLELGEKVSAAGEGAEKERIQEEAARAGLILGNLSDALKEGVASIVRTFGSGLAAFKFPSSIARKLQGFVDYS
ncbi:hypothetical protein PLICRDRAFT_178687 [Plicaturopsis crispa FD-325 SS-3]|nr:hypothetical protein PLICRDRAFT_178687 [Plicaturopsis crispa FD-325 SS-3]